MDGNAVADRGKLAAALVAFQANVPTVAKSRTAKIPTKGGGTYSYNYADLADIQNAIRKPLADQKLAVTQLLIGGESGWTTIRTSIWHESGQAIESDLTVKTEGKTPQEAGSLFTYYKRYALGAALGISTEDDDDGKAGQVNEERPRAQAARGGQPTETFVNPPTAKQLQIIRKIASQLKIADEAIEERIKSLKSSKAASNAITAMDQKLKALPGKSESSDA